VDSERKAAIIWEGNEEIKVEQKTGNEKPEIGKEKLWGFLQCLNFESSQ
jgi:hypothetical protein